MENVILKIYGDIGEPDAMMAAIGVNDSISSKSVSEFLEANVDAKKITVKINSRGGDVQEGWAIHDLLVNSGKTIKTIGEGKIYSIATIIFLAGSEREIMQNADGLIHNPYIPPYTLADRYESSDLEKIAQGLKQEEEKILDFYARKTGSDKEKLREYMVNDTKLSAEDMVALGFATKIVEPVMAFAYYNPNFKSYTMDEKSFFEKLGSSLEGALAKMKNLSRIVAQKITDTDGKELTLEKDGVPSVGDKASPDGSYTLESGKVIIVSDGVISEIVEATPALSDLEIATQKITDLEAKITELEASKAEAEIVKVDAERVKTEAMEIITELSNLRNSWKPEVRSRVNTADKVGRIDLNRVRQMREENFHSQFKNK